MGSIDARGLKRPIGITCKGFGTTDKRHFNTCWKKEVIEECVGRMNLEQLKKSSTKARPQE